jgi:dihydrolipoamide dehydrogenase
MLSKSFARNNAILSQYSRFGFSSVKEFDVAIIGGGPGGYVAAIKAAQKGLKTVCIEKRGTLGGTCLNVGCIPSKAMLNATHHLHDAKHKFKDMGIITGPVSCDFNQLQKSKDTAVTGLTGGIEYLFKKNGVTYSKGWGKFASANEIDVDLNDGKKEQIKAKNIIIATGSAPNGLPESTGLATDEEYIVSSTGALALKKVPKKMVVVGGGVIGLELGSVYQRLGTEVTVIQHTERICPFLDAEIGKAFQQSLKKQGITFLLNTRVVDGVNNKEKGVKVNLHNHKDDKYTTLDCDVALISIGRHAYTDGLQLEKAGLSADERGVIPTNDHWQTKHSHIYGIGDVVKGAMLAHKAEEEGIAAVEHILGEGGHVNYAAIPGVIYTHPEVAWVGKSEEELKAEGVKYKKGTFPMSANSRARTNNDADGLVKILTCAETDKILGAHCLSSNAGEMIAEGVLAFEYGASAEDVARTCHAHPTMSEAFKEACMAATDKAIHF